MNVEITVKIEGREVATIQQDIPLTKAIPIEEHTERLKDRVGQVVLEQSFEQLDAELKTPCCCGRRMENRGQRGVTWMSQSGEIRVVRKHYRCRVCGDWQRPLDQVVCLGPHRITKHLGKLVCQLATLEHFPQLEKLLFDQHQVALGHDEMMQLVHEAGQAAEASRRAEVELWQQTPPEKRRWPQAFQTPPKVYVSCDGIMYCTNQREPDPLHPGQNRLVWKQMRVGCVYWQKDETHWHKRVIWGQEDYESFGASLFRLACRLGYHEAKDKLFLADGGEWCWSIRDLYFAGADGILDWYHASQHVWTCSKSLSLKGDEATAWANEALDLLWQNGGTDLWNWLVPQHAKARGARRKALDQLIGYVGPRQALMDYPRYRRNDWQIGSGMIESTARQLVGQRLKGPGMQWSVDGATAITALRAQDLNGEWHSFWNQFHLANPPTTVSL